MQAGQSQGADTFLASPAGEYVGRTCPWKDCRPGIRMSCEAQHCGQREYLYDDLQNIQLKPEVIAKPPIELWPNPGAHSSETSVPEDVAETLVKTLVAEARDR